MTWQISFHSENTEIYQNWRMAIKLRSPLANSRAQHQYTIQVRGKNIVLNVVLGDWKGKNRRQEKMESFPHNRCIEFKFDSISGHNM
jgi:hypothetical protein